MTVDRRYSLPRAALTRREFSIGLAGAALSTSAIRPTWAAESPQDGGTLKIAMAGSSANETIDPHKAVSSTDASRITSLFNRLVGTQPDLQLVGELAESWESDAAAQEWTFHLRPGIVFHDGRPLRAADVIYSLRRLVDPATASPAKALFDQVDLEGTRADGDRIVRVKLARPNADLAALFADYHAMVVPEGFTDFSNPVGTGPFMLERFEPGVVSLFVRNPNYWEAGLPHLEAVETTGINDPVARTNALLAGEADLIEKLDPTAIERIKSNPDLQIISSPSGFHIVFAMQTDKPPFDNPNVRMALKLLLDRQRFLDTVYKGYGQLGNDQPVSPAHQWYCRDLGIPSYDPERAKALLAEAGLANPTFDLHASTVLAGMMDGAIVFQEMAAKAGVTINIIREPTDGYWSAVWLKKPFFMGGWTMRPVADMILTQAYTSDAKWNETNWHRAEFDSLLVDARGTTDVAERQRLYCEAQRMISKDGGAIIPVFTDILDAGSKRVNGLQPHPIGTLGHWQWKTVWLAS
ncbi:MAG: ABC transporter substrate-binding protein [Dongiaceae bacterium]